MRCVLIEYIPHVGLDSRVVSNRKISHGRAIDSISQIRLPYRTEIKLRLLPPPLERTPRCPGESGGRMASPLVTLNILKARPVYNSPVMLNSLLNGHV